MSTTRKQSNMVELPATEATRAQKRQKGAVLVEFALVLPILVIVLFGIISFSVGLYNKTVLTMGAREGARAGALYVPDLTGSEKISNAETAAEQLMGDKIISFGSGSGPVATAAISGDDLTVTTSVNYTGIFVFLDFSGFLISSSTTMRIE